MKALIFDIKRFAVHDGDGIRTTVFFKGCPLRCVWCHNPEGLSARPQLAFYQNKCVSCGECVKACTQNAHAITGGIHRFDQKACTACGKCEAACAFQALSLYGKEWTVDELLPLLLADEDFYRTSGGGVTLSGGECLLQADFCALLLWRLKEKGIHTAVDTCGFVAKEAISKVLPHTDLFLYDIKAFDTQVHIHCTTQPNGPILKNLKYIDACRKPVEVRIPYVPEYNSGEVEKIANFLKTLKSITKVTVLPYHNYAGSKYDALCMKNTLPARLPSPQELSHAKSLLSACGLAVTK